MGRTTGKRKSTKEVDWEAEFCKLLGDLSIKTEKMEDPLRAGTPDRYLGQGRWIEFKRLIYNSAPKRATGRPRSVDRLMRLSQRRRIPSLLAMGDRVWTCIFLLDTADSPARVWFGPWRETQGMGDDVALRDSFLFDRSVEKCIKTVQGVLDK